LLALDANAIAGICSAGGGPGAHAAIIAASLGIPFLVAAGPAVHSIADGTDLILDAEQGLLCIAPEQRRVDAIRQAIALRHMQDQRDKANAMLPTRSRDGVAITVYANLGASTEVPQAMANGAEGCGLFRTEFLFLDRQNAPDEQEQFELYQEVCNQMGGKPVTIRTMDIGGDKPIPYLALPREENPALGLRGIRTSLWRDALFIDQLRAILRLPADSGARILLPMINDSAEVAMAKSYILRCAEDLGIKQLPEIGIMIETPASVMLIEQLLGMVDFVSIGSNDLSQYVLAIDRGHPELAGKLDALHPAVLRMIQHAAQAAKAANKKISLCGGLASDPVALAVLLGLGVLELSVLPTLIPRVKSLLRQFDLRACQALALDAINEKDAASVRALCTQFIARSGHGVFS
jgi:phosphoenolpyruvate-protein phosphotransferase